MTNCTRGEVRIVYEMNLIHGTGNITDASNDETTTRTVFIFKQIGKQEKHVLICHDVPSIPIELHLQRT